MTHDIGELLQQMSGICKVLTVEISQLKEERDALLKEVKILRITVVESDKIISAVPSRWPANIERSE